VSPEPDLSAELDAAEDIVMGRAETVETEWGIRVNPDRPDAIWIADDEEGHADAARRLAAQCGPGALVRRTVTYGPWEEVTGEH
jgi:hypothetical protein